MFSDLHVPKLDAPPAIFHCDGSNPETHASDAGWFALDKKNFVAWIQSQLKLVYHVWQPVLGAFESAGSLGLPVKLELAGLRFYLA